MFDWVKTNVLLLFLQITWINKLHGSAEWLFSLLIVAMKARKKNVFSYHSISLLRVKTDSSKMWVLEIQTTNEKTELTWSVLGEKNVTISNAYILRKRVQKLETAFVRCCQNRCSKNFRWKKEKFSQEIITGKNLCWSLFLIKAQAFMPAILLKTDSNTGVFLWILRTF